MCDGTDSEKLDWFRIINIAGEQLTDQELRNAVYAGSWVSDAKRYLMKEAQNNVYCKRWKLYVPLSLKGLIDKGVGDYDAIG